MPNPCDGGVSGNVTEPVKVARGAVRAVIMMLAIAGIAAVSVPMSAQSAPGVSQGSSTLDPAIQRNVDEWIQQGRGVADDWSHHRMVFSDAGTMQESTANGTFEHWLKVSNEPRYTMQVIRRMRNATPAGGADATASATPAARTGSLGMLLGARTQGTKLDKDWSMDLGGGTASTLTGTVGSNGATGTSTVTVDGVTLDASAAVAASTTGTFTGAPGAGQSVTITNGSNALSLVTNAATSSAIGTVSAAPTSTISPTITVTNSAGSPANTLSLTTNGTGATATVTVSGSGPSDNQTITVTSGSNTVTLTLSGSASTPGTGTITTSNSVGAADGDTLTIGSVTYTFEQSTSGSEWCTLNSGTCRAPYGLTNAAYDCPNTTSPCLWWGTTAANTAQTIFAAITNNPSACPAVDVQGGVSTWQHTCYSYITAPNPSVNATYTTGSAAVSLTNISGSGAPFLTASTQGAFTLSSNAGSVIPGNTTGTGTATFSGTAASGSTVTIGGTTYTFETTSLTAAGSVLYGASATTSAGNLNAAINDNSALCVSTAPCFNVSAANASVGSGVSAGVLTVSNLTTSAVAWSTTGSAVTLSPTSTIPAPSGSCTSSTAGTLNASTTPATMASYLASAINSCDIAYPAVGVTATASGGVVTVTDTAPGSSATALSFGGNASDLTWSSVTAGSPGSNGCTSSTTGTFASGSTTAAVASNIAAAINSCNSSYPAVGVIANYASGNTFTVASPAPGPFLTESGSNLTGLFSWGSVVVGSAGTNSCTSSTSGTLAYSSSTATMASNLVAAIAACGTAYPAVGVTATSSGAVVTVTASTAGAGGNSITLGNTLSNFTWSGANLSGGSDGVTSGTTFAYSGLSASQLAANIAAAINANPTLQQTTPVVGVTATSNGATVTVTGRAPGAGSYGTATASLTGFTWGNGGAFVPGTAGPITGAVGAGVYPAKYSFDPSAAPACANAAQPDFVVYSTAVGGSATQASLVAYDNLYVNSTGTGQCAGATTPSIYWAYDTGGTILTSPTFWYDGSQVAFVHSTSSGAASLVVLKWAPSATARGLTVTASSGSQAFTVTKGQLAATDVGAQVSGPGIPAGDTIASVNTVANAGTLATAAISGAGVGETLSIYAETTLTPGVPPMVTPANYAACTAPCMTSVAFSDGNPDTNSAPYWDYGTGTIYVGDNGGYLHQFQFAFGNPQETSGWPIPVSGNKLTGPVYDSAASPTQVFVADSGGFLYSFNTSTGALVGKSSQLAKTGSTGIRGRAHSRLLHRCRVCHGWGGR